MHINHGIGLRLLRSGTGAQNVLIRPCCFWFKGIIRRNLTIPKAWFPITKRHCNWNRTVNETRWFIIHHWVGKPCLKPNISHKQLPSPAQRQKTLLCNLRQNKKFPLNRSVLFFLFLLLLKQTFRLFFSPITLHNVQVWHRREPHRHLILWVAGHPHKCWGDANQKGLQVCALLQW